MFVAAAGNDGVNNDTTAHYPSAYNLPNIIAVAAVDQTSRLTSFSNYGVRTVDIAAPGAQILSTTPNNTYQSFSGTSMAAPFVTGVAGLLLGQNPNLSLPDLKNAILNNVTTVAALSGRIATGGRLNAFAAISGIPSATPGTPPQAPAPVEIIAPGVNTLNVGDTLQLSATGGDGTYVWRINSNGAATISNRGLLTAIAPGTARVSVRDGAGVTSPSMDFTINAVTTPPPTSMSITPNTVTQLNVGDTQQFNVTGGTPPITWTTSNAAVTRLTPASNGQTVTVLADQAGDFTLTATDSLGTTTTSAMIRVVGTSALSLNAPKTSLNTGETIQLAASGGTSPYTWSTTNARVATVDNGGLVTAVNQGIASITVQDSAGGKTTVNIQVNAVGGGELVITPNMAPLAVGASTRLKATGGGLQLTWTSSDPAVASIDSRGVVKAIAPGTATISVKDEKGNSGQANIDVRGITITASVLTIGAGDTLQLTASGGKAPYDWSVSNPSLASIDANGLLTTTLGATGGILVTATDVDGVSKSIIVTINNSTALRAPMAH